ncbi:MAG: phage terminase large subunit, partial [Tenuifilaceae bacterium]|nr:phage terminase large subunit [Tenuifilaceae bacterium]
LFQGRPTSMEGNMIKRSWFKYLDTMPIINYKLISVDATFKDGDNSDYVAIQVWGKTNTNYYFIDRVKAKMDFVDTLVAIRNIQAKHRADVILIEDKANGSAIISMLRNEFDNIIPVNPEGGKVARVNAVAPILEAGNVHLLREEWNNDFVEECASFPNGKHDDDVDAMSQALNRLRDVNAVDMTPTEQDLYYKRKYEEEVEAIAGSGWDDLLGGM